LVDWLLVVDPDKCSGCSICEAWCSIKNEGQCNPSRSRIRVVKWEFHGIFIPVVCQQCEKPMCKEVCPLNAITQDPETGAYVVDASTCVGCRLCTIACPIGAINVDPQTKTAMKCDLCGGDPLCAKFCPSGAIKYLRSDRTAMELKREAMQKISKVLGRAITEREIAYRTPV